TPQNTSKYLDFALEMAAAAETPIMRHFRHCEADCKPDGSEVTIADREAETVIRDMIAARYPDHGVIGEEFGDAGSGDKAFQWVIDPIDGTTSFAWGIHAFGTLIALMENGQPIVGVINMPALKEAVYGAKGEGCWFREGSSEPQRVCVAPCDRLEDALISTSTIAATDLDPKTRQPGYRLSEVIRRARKLRFCGDCIQHALVCRGRIHAAIDPVMQPWDIAALIPCIEEAGGVATSLTGEREHVVFRGSLLTSANADLHAEIVKRLRPAR
ncbi:MAG TPA: inositol monophosphatase family protein, partial [Phycisphaerae bacterium]|nr:inositol monophosphatase family protein [Phycisphaerae bacterium]